MKKIISILITITMWLSLFPVIHAEEAKETVWSFGSETDISTDVSALDNPVIKDAAQYDNSLGAVKCYGGNDLTLTLSNPIEISENAKITVEADIAYSKESGGKYLGYTISSSSGNGDLLNSYLSAYSSTADTTLKLGGIEKLTENTSGANGRPASIYNPSSTADTSNGWTHYKAVFDYNAQLITLTISSSKGTDEYTSPLNYETDIRTLHFISNNSSGRPCYIDNIKIIEDVSDIPYVPGKKVMSIVTDAAGDNTVIDTSSLYRDAHVSNFVVTTVDLNGNIILCEKVAADTEIMVDTANAVKAEVVPIFRYENIGSLQNEKVLKNDAENGLYNFTFKKQGTKRADIYVNGSMVANNVDKDGYNRKIAEAAEISVHDIVIDGNAVKLSMTDTSDYNMSWCEFYRASAIANRKTKIYILGDSLVANYYGTASDINKSQAGWGQVIDSYFTDDVETVNLANGGHYATILETTAFPGVIANAQSGDYLIIECGYNDTKYNNADITRESVERMVNSAKDKGIIPIVVSPNASMQECDGTAEYLKCIDDYTPDVHFAQAMQQAAENTNTLYVNLSKESYDFYRENYGDDKEIIKNNYYFPNETDILHHNYLGAMNCARIVAQEMYDSGIKDFINIDYRFEFEDTTGKTITYKINTSSEPPSPSPSPTPSSQTVHIKGSVTVNQGIYSISADAGTLNGKLIAVAYKNGVLQCMKTADYNGASVMLEMEPKSEADNIKLMLWNSVEKMTPLCEAVEIPKDKWISDSENTPPPSENEAEIINLAGEWGLKLGSYSNGTVANDTCSLPGTLSENEKGTKNNSADKTRLSLKYKYTGAAVYQKKIDIPSDWSEKSVMLTLERTKNTRVWINGEEQTNYNTNDSLVMPHEYYLSNLKAGEENIITVEVTNGSYDLFRTKTHMLTEETQNDWNGIIGEVALKATDKIYIKDVKVYPDAEKKIANVKVTVRKDTDEAVNGTLTLSATSYNHEGEQDRVSPMTEDISLTQGKGETTLEYAYNMGNNVKLWSEFHPALYRMTVSVNMDNGAKNDYTESFGMRDFSKSDGQFTINGNKTFLRGEANSAVFPLTGYPFMTKAEWKKFFGKAQSMGINFFRFHSWAPPMAAFEAADEMGIYMQPEMYGFGGTPTGFDTLYGKEGERILEYFASNPSFVMMTFGNEMTTSSTDTQSEIKSFRARLKSIDPTRLYAEGTNNNLSDSKINTDDDFWTTAKVAKSGNDKQVRLSFAWNNSSDGGRLEGEQPNSCQDFNKAMEYLNSDIPVMGHETGQYQVYPNFKKEIPKYENGVFAPRNLSNFQSIMEKKGLSDMNETFSRVTARTSAISYRADIEAALKTAGFGGYQLLSIQDFPGQNTALVGILDSFMDDKDGGFTSEEYKSFNSPITTLAKLPKYMYNQSDSFNAEVVVTNYSEENLNNVSAKWSLAHEDGTLIKEGTLTNVDALQGTVTSLGSIEENGMFVSVNKAEKLIFTVSAAGSENSYSIWVYPENKEDNPDNLLIADAYTKEVRDTLEAGGRVLMLPTPNETNLPNSVAVRWTNDYWSSMFHGRVAGAATTMGLYVNEEHPVFKNFPTEYFGDYQWYNLMKNSRAIVLDDAPIDLKPMAQNIDHMAYSRKLGSIFEAKVGEGNLLVCTMDILNQMEKYPEVRQMYNSLVQYASSSEFKPETQLTTEYLRTIFKQIVSSTGEIPAYEEISAFDYSWAQTTTELTNQSGTDDSGNTVENAAGGFTAGDMIRFDNVNFKGNGSSKIKLSASNSAQSAGIIEVYLGSDKGDKVAELEVQSTGGSDKFKRFEFDIPHISGIKNICLKFVSDKLSLNSISFEEDKTEYRNPYTVIDPSNTSAGAVKFQSLGGSYETEQLTVKITDAVRVIIPNCDFGFDGSSKLILGGSIINSQTELNLNIVYSDNGEEKKIPVYFRMGEGEQYTVTSGTTGEYKFYRNTIELSQNIKGVQNLGIEFPTGTLFEFSDISFTDSAREPKIWDFTKAVESKTTFDTVADKTFEYNGITIVGGGSSDYLDNSVGMHYNGATSVSDGKANRYISYMPKKDGVLKITAKRAYNRGSLYVSESISTNNGRAIDNLSNNTSWQTGEISLSAYTTYYFYCFGSGVEIKSMEFIPD